MEANLAMMEDTKQRDEEESSFNDDDDDDDGGDADVFFFFLLLGLEEFTFFLPPSLLPTLDLLRFGGILIVFYYCGFDSIQFNSIEWSSW